MGSSRGPSKTRGPTVGFFLSQNWPYLVALGGIVVWITVMIGALERKTIDMPLVRTGQSRVRSGKVLLSEIIAASLQLSEYAAHEIIEVKQAGHEEAHVKGKTDEGVDEPVTVADARANSVFVNGLRQLFPGISILSEETEPDPLVLDMSPLEQLQLEEDPWLDLKDLLITVDPLDATKEFTENLVHYVTTMVCIVHKGRPIAGVINEPFMRGQGAIWGVTLDSGYKALHGLVKKEAEGEAKDTVVVSRSHTGQGGDVVTQYIKGHKPLFAGGSGFKALKVLKGDAAAYLHVTKIKSWDVCAADALVHSAGGEFTDLKGRSIEYHHDRPLLSNGLIATSHPETHQSYVQQLSSYEMQRHAKK